MLNLKNWQNAIPGIIRFEKENLVSLEMKRIENLREHIEKTFFFYDSISIRIKAGQDDAVSRLAEEIKEMIRLAKIFDKKIHIEITGHTDSIGTEERNTGISQKRADEFAFILSAQGIERELFTARGVASKEPLKEELTEHDREFNRCVNFKAVITDQ